MNILEQLQQELSPYELTVQEQARTAENDPTLSYPTYFPTRSVESVKLADITVVDARVIGDRREWNADGRHIPALTPPAHIYEMVPLEAYFGVGEREIQHLGERFGGNAELILRAAKARITDRVSSLTEANIWANEWESLRAWTEGEITIMNPQTGLVYLASLDFDPNRYVVDATPWDDTNAFNRLLLYAREAENFIGAIAGVRVRQDIALLIAESAPTIGANSVKMTLRDVQKYLSDSLGTDFMIWTDERAVNKFDGAGNDRTATKLFPEDTVAFVPSTGSIGYTGQAPIFRAEDISPATQPDSVDMNGQRIFYRAENFGKSLVVQAQANWLAIPNEQNVFIVNITQE